MVEYDDGSLVENGLINYQKIDEDGTRRSQIRVVLSVSLRQLLIESTVERRWALRSFRGVEWVSVPVSGNVVGCFGIDWPGRMRRWSEWNEVGVSGKTTRSWYGLYKEGVPETLRTKETDLTKRCSIGIPKESEKSSGRSLQ